MIQKILLQSYIVCNIQAATWMAIKNEHPEKHGWWLSELQSLGVSPKVYNELNDMQEVSNLTEILKQTFYQQYKTTYND